MDIIIYPSLISAKYDPRYSANVVWEMNNQLHKTFEM